MRKERKLEYHYFASIEDLDSVERELMIKAKEIATSAQAPYSKFRVGAAALLDNDDIKLGFNVENAAYPQCMCAEQVLLSTIKSSLFKGSIKVIAIACLDGLAKEPLSPCGSCRQILREQESRQNSPIQLLLHNASNEIWRFNSISDILPFSFGTDAF